MVMEERFEKLDEVPGLLTSDAGDIVPVDIKTPARPHGLTEKEDLELKERAIALVKGLVEAEGSKEMELADSITNLGAVTQRRAGADLGLLRGRVGQMLSGGDSGDEIFKNLVELRSTLNQINPEERGASSIVKRAMAIVPFVGEPTVKILERIAIRYEPVSKQVCHIETRLREGRAMLARDNVELRKLYEQVEEQQTHVQRNAYLGELVVQDLHDRLDSTENQVKQERLRNVLNDVVVRVQDLRAMEAVYGQFFVSIEMTRQNNNQLGQSVERTLTLSSNVVHIGLAIRMALIRQKRVMYANNETREFLGNLITANAASVLRHTQEIGDVRNNPVIAMEKITQARNDLIDAMNTLDRIKDEGTQVAQRNIDALNRLNAEFEQRVGALKESDKDLGQHRALEA